MLPSGMRQFSIKNDRAAETLERITRITGEGKTKAVVRALELYERMLLEDRGVAQAIASIRRDVHAHLKAAWRGKAPGKAEIEDELGMP